MKKIVLAAAVSAALSPAAFAADPMTIVITASRTEQAAADVTAPVTVITKEDIEQQQPKSVAEAVAMTPGLQIISNGGYGQASSLYLRGLDQNRMLVLVDGVQIGSATKGETKLEHISIDQIERIEIVRGARSSLYGANAIAGVIQIFTKKPNKESTYAGVVAGYGSNNTVQSSAEAGWSNQSSQLDANVSYFKTDGFDVQPEKSSLGVDDDGYLNKSLKLNGTHNVGRNKFSAGLQYSTGYNDFDNRDNSNDAKTEFKYTTLHAGLESQLTESFKVTSKASHYRDDNLTVVKGVDEDSFITKTKKFEVQAEKTLNKGLLVIAGVDYKLDDVSESTKDYAETTRDNKALFALVEKSDRLYQAALSARVDQNEAFGDYSTYGIDGQLHLTSKISVLASHATAFVTPTFNQLYWPGAGNTDLKPETSETSSVGAKFNHNNQLNIELNLYRTRINNMIGGWPPTNTDKAEINGIEFFANAVFSNTTLTANASLLDTEDKKTGKELTYRAEQTAKVRITHRLDKLTVGLDSQYTGERYTDNANTNKLPGYTLLNLDTQFQFSKKLILSGSVKNLTNKEYVSKKGYATAGRTVFGSVRYRF